MLSLAASQVAESPWWGNATALPPLPPVPIVFPPRLLRLCEVQPLTKFEKTISNCILHFGFEPTVEQVIFPFLRQTGNMWQLGIINAAQEHFISNLIRQKLIVGIDSVFPGQLTKPKKVVLYLPNKELHELGLLYCHFLIKAKGHACTYLGQSVPFEDLLSVSEIIKPEVIITGFTNLPEDIGLQDYLNKLSKAFPDKTILVSGRVFFEGNVQVQFPKNIILFESHEQVKNMLQSVTFTG